MLLNDLKKKSRLLRVTLASLLVGVGVVFSVLLMSAGQGAGEEPVAGPSDEIRRTKPDFVHYDPKDGNPPKWNDPDFFWLNEHDGRRILWYSDRKSFLLRKLIPDSMLDAMTVPAEPSAVPEPLRYKPNVIVIMTDDLGYGDLGCYGNEVIKTPCIDRMANEGTRFTDFYVPAAQCSPARAAFLTGSYPQRINCHRLIGGDDLGINPDEITIAELLGKQGYHTGCIGKWHLGDKPLFHPNNHGFDYFYGFLNPSYADKANRLIYRNRKLVAKGPESSRITGDLTREAVEFIQRHKEHPFFLYLAHDMPHVPLELPTERRGTSRGGRYGDVIEHLDWSVGKVLEALRDHGLERNTIVLFTSDNGPAIHWSPLAGSAGPLRGSKHTTCEGGFRVPFIAWGPGHIAAGIESSELITIMDLLPTFTELAGGTVPTDRVIDGKDVWSLLSGAAGARSPYDAFFYYKRDRKAGHIEGVRVGNWKLRVPLASYHEKAKQRNGEFVLVELKAGKNGQPQTWKEQLEIVFPNLETVQLEAAKEEIGLYNLAEDIGENVNLACQYPEKVKELRSLMKTFDTELRANSRPVGKSSEKKESQ